MGGGFYRPNQSLLPVLRLLACLSTGLKQFRDLLSPNLYALAQKANLSAHSDDIKCIIRRG